MLQTIAALIPAAMDYERTLVLAIEVSNKNWVRDRSLRNVIAAQHVKRAVPPMEPLCNVE
jgi:hypothetical protein